MAFEKIFKNGTHIKWNRGDDGGGSTQYLDFLNIFLQNKKTYNNCLEWCAGLSAIAFSLLDAKVVDKVALMDKYKPALDTAMANAIANNLGDKVTIYHLEEINKLPAHERFDLVVANPPHVPFHSYREGDHTHESDEHGIRMVIDQDWATHKEFFASIVNYLTDGAEVYLSEIYERAEFVAMAKEAGLTYKGPLNAPRLANDSASSARIMYFKYEKEVH